MRAFYDFARDCIGYNTAFYKKPDMLIGVVGLTDPKDALADSVCGDVHALLDSFADRLPMLEQIFDQHGPEI